MNAPAICPHCGYDLRRAEVTVDGPWQYDPGIGVMHDGSRLAMSPQCHEIVGAIMMQSPRVIAKPVLAERIGYDGERADHYIHVLVCKARKACRELGVVLPVEAIWGVGLVWIPQTQAEAA
jgi:hypothetical protein